MPTLNGTIDAELLWHRDVRSTVDDYTFRIANRNISAESSFSLINVNNKKSYWIETGIRSIVSNGRYEAFDPPEPRIIRNNVTEITFRAAATSSARIKVRHAIRFWH